MPVTTTNVAANAQTDPRYQAVKTFLVAEWSRQTGQSGATSPDIVEYVDNYGFFVAVTVVWDEWSDLSASERAALIVDALRDVRGSAAGAYLTATIGLTTTEFAARHGRPLFNWL